MSLTTKQKNIRAQLSTERDFAQPGQTEFIYFICCNHRTGSNLLSEALYRTGLAGDPMEYLNVGFLREYGKMHGQQNLDFFQYFRDMRARRTSPNGVFGANVKFDQLRTVFKRDFSIAERMLRDAHAYIFLYRRNKLDQAVSAYKGQVRDVFNVMEGESADALRKDVPVPFQPHRIANNIQSQLKIDQDWLSFFEDNNIEYYSLAYEDLVEDYEAYIYDILRYLGIEAGPDNVPPKPTIKVGDRENDVLARQFLAYLDPEGKHLAGAVEAAEAGSRSAQG